MIGHHTRLRENDDLPLWRGPAVKKKPPFLMRVRYSRVKLCAVGMRNAILGNNLKHFVFGDTTGPAKVFRVNYRSRSGLPVLVVS